MGSSFPANVHVSAHPCLRAKLSQLRSHTASTRETKLLVHEITTILASTPHGSQPAYRTNSLTSTTVAIIQDKTPLGVEYTTEGLAPSSLALVPILRSGLGMLDAIQSLLPDDIPVHHLGLFRERSTLQPVEYYNNLPFHRPDTFSKTDTTSAPNELAAHTAILVDPVIATGGTADAAIQLLRDWGVQRILYLSVLGSEGGVRRAAEEWPEGVQVWVGAVDQTCDERGMIVPGLGDIGDRLFKAVGK
ncbi:uracil phosphoribosyltransferase [Paecilomyces variotii No. 5]|uniref:uracil phosphoribosyltransferase n=1 Tax=Byssochlamys spectabilis (strain No. 5 / NBRC 109023) TaxID=1356009 RepID=V5HQW7_BYSSN|nr:uracil phosphoribosyltransferase [Paecilomyces variotii No. 5]